jgi:putative colanic acid biosynthesis acetyltransferase WcaF
MTFTLLPPPSLGDKARRTLFRIVWVLLCLPTPPPLHAWRRLILRLFGAKIGRGVQVYPSVRIWAPWKLTMEDGSQMGPGVDCYNVSHVTVGAGAKISQRVFLCPGTRDFRLPDMPAIVADIRIGPRAWLAAEAFVGAGVDIGERAVVGARAVVMKSVEAGVVVAGNPARPVSKIA